MNGVVVSVRCSRPKLKKVNRFRWNYPFGRNSRGRVGGLKKVDFYCSFCGKKVSSRKF